MTAPNHSNISTSNPACNQEDTLASAIAAHIMDQSTVPTDAESWWPTWDKIYACDSLDSSLYRKQGCLFQFLNNNAQGMAGSIGGLRTNLTDIRKIPQYIQKNEGHIKNYAIKLLNQHMIKTQCATGAGESLCQDDYGISFTVASLSPKGLQLHATRRNEGPLFFCLYDGLVEPIILSRNEENQILDSAYLINVYVNLLPPTQRRTAVLKKMHEESKMDTSLPVPPKKSKGVQTSPTDAPQVTQGYQGNQGNHQGFQQNHNQNYQGSYPNNIPTYQGGYQGRRPYPQGPTNEDVIKSVASMQTTMEAKFKVLEAKQIPLPALPQPSAPVWPVVSSALPDE